jgi:hypothetical protein
MAENCLLLREGKRSHEKCTGEYLNPRGRQKDNIKKKVRIKHNPNFFNFVKYYCSVQIKESGYRGM